MRTYRQKWLRSAASMEMFPSAWFSRYLSVNVQLYSQGKSHNSEMKLEVGSLVFHVLTQQFSMTACRTPHVENKKFFAWLVSTNSWVLSGVGHAVMLSYSVIIRCTSLSVSPYCSVGEVLPSASAGWLIANLTCTTLLSPSTLMVLNCILRANLLTVMLLHKQWCYLKKHGVTRIIQYDAAL